MRNLVIVVVGISGIALTACGTSAPPGSTRPAASSPAGKPAAKQWTRESVTAMFLSPAEAGLTGGEIVTGPRNQMTRIGLCVSLNPLRTPTVAVDKRYATDRHEIGVPYKGHLIQQGWVLPSEADATRLMKQVGSQLSRCRYSGSAPNPLEPRTRISGTSTPRIYPPDSFGWHGHRIEQTMSRDGKRASVSTQLLVQRGPVVLSLDYINYTRDVLKQKLWAANMAVLHKVLAHAA